MDEKAMKLDREEQKAAEEERAKEARKVTFSRKKRLREALMERVEQLLQNNAEEDDQGPGGRYLVLDDFCNNQQSCIVESPGKHPGCRGEIILMSAVIPIGEDEVRMEEFWLPEAMVDTLGGFLVGYRRRLERRERDM